MYSVEWSCHKASEKALAAYITMAEMLHLKLDRRRLNKYISYESDVVMYIVQSMLTIVTYNTENNLCWVLNKYKNDKYVDNKVKGRYSLVKQY